MELGSKDTASTTSPSLDGAPTEAVVGRAPLQAEGKIAELSALLHSLEQGESASRASTPELSIEQENRLVQVRSGVGASLFHALRWKHEPTARHALRVTLNCAAWARRLHLSREDRDHLELAALMHDIGKIGVPDHILAKPGPLSAQEVAVMESHWLMGCEILRASCTSQAVLDNLVHARSWFDGTRATEGRQRDALPLGARMLCIVDAFDAMLTEQVYRKAMSRERACEELHRFAGRQFDPALVRSYMELLQCDLVDLQQSVTDRWLRDLDPELVNSQWQLNVARTEARPRDGEFLFQQKLLANMYDAVIFVDTNLRVILWNRAAERLTGISEASIHQRRFIPSLLSLQDENGRVVEDVDCPLAYTLRTGVQWLRRLSLRGRGGRVVSVDAHAVPVQGSDGTPHGLTLLLHDVSPQISLEERCQNLHVLATKDPLTQVANRAEFERVHEQFVDAHLENRLPCSLIIADIDRFKLVNDTFGHQAGDEVIQSFARVLKAGCRQGDLVARYGGEEFVVLCADCDSAGVERRAEELRQAFGAIEQPVLNGQQVTASFGVTEIQAGDSPETMLRRADRALLDAKEGGRNRVVQLGTGLEVAEPHAEGSRTRCVKHRPDVLAQQNLICESPLERCVEKIKGFIADHQAEVVGVEGSELQLKINSISTGRRRRDRSARLFLHLEIEELQPHPAEGTGRTRSAQTLLHVSVTPQRSRERRHDEARVQACELISSLRAYLMATEANIVGSASMLGKTKSLISSWFRRG